MSESIRSVYILYRQYLDDFGEKRKIGGVESYIRNLSVVFMECGFETYIVQCALKDFQVEENKKHIIGVKIDPQKKAHIKMKALLKRIEKRTDKNQDVLVFATDYLLVPNEYKNVIAIQHGIAWDINKRQRGSFATDVLSVWGNALRSIMKIIRFQYCKHLVCVDYIFLNWYRTQASYINNSLHVIVNFVHIPSSGFIKRQDRGEVSVIFARRFIEYRGTRIFVESILQVINKHRNINVTIAGEGPDEQWMKNQLKGYSQIKFASFGSEESVRIHQQHDIAVIPSRASEGTSLSLLEAMAASCAVIATNVGGMTNIILDGYNGLLIEPNVSALVHALEKLITDYELRNRLSEKAFETAKEAFSYNQWVEKWKELIRKLN